MAACGGAHDDKNSGARNEMDLGSGLFQAWAHGIDKHRRGGREIWHEEKYALIPMVHRVVVLEHRLDFN